VHSYASHITIFCALNLSQVQATPHFQPKRPQPIPNLAGADDCWSWAVKERQKAIARCGYFVTAKAT
jgi:hypothetical protein